MVLDGLARPSAIKALMTGHAGSIAVRRPRRLTLGLRGYPWCSLWRPSPPVLNASRGMEGGVVEGLVADVVAQAVDGRGEREHVDHGVKAGRQQTPADAEDDAQTSRADHETEQAAVEHVLVPPAFVDVARVALDDIGLLNL